MELKDLRKNIDEIDDQITELYKKRMSLVREVAERKKEGEIAVADKKRENDILNRVLKNSGGIDVFLRVLFYVLFSTSRAYQNLLINETRRLKNNCLIGKITEAIKNTPESFPERDVVVACQGIKGAFSQQACDSLFSAAEIIYASDFEEVFDKVEAGLCDYGILPIENSSYGSVIEVYDLMKTKKFNIARGVKLRVSHAFLSKLGVLADDIKEIVSHGQALGQCSDFLKKYPDAKITTCENTAVAAKFVSDSSRKDIAAIASSVCADFYGLEVLNNNVQNNDNNYTRFICVSKDLEIFSDSNRISLMVLLPHETGSLYSLLEKFASIGINLEKIESRPIPGKNFQFMFYFDFIASVSDKNLLNLIDEMSGIYSDFIFLGNYLEK